MGGCLPACVYDMDAMDRSAAALSTILTPNDHLKTTIHRAEIEQFVEDARLSREEDE